MTIIGQQLLQPEASWTRYDDTDNRFVGFGDFKMSLTDTSGYAYSNSIRQSNVIGDSIYFKFYGTKLRLLGALSYNRSTVIEVTIDGVKETFSQYSETIVGVALNYEKTNLTRGIHIVKITNINSGYYCFDCIDIDSDGKLLHPVLTERENVEDMLVHDVIPCKYIATTSGVTGYFCELGVSQITMIPLDGSATPNGGFYFIKTATGLLIADRVLQHSIPWDIINAKGYIDGSITTINIHPYMTAFTQGRFTASSDGSIVGAGCEAYKAFNGVYTGGSDYSDYKNASYIQLNTGQRSRCNCVRILSYATSYNSGNWRAEGSYDGVTWFQLSQIFLINTTSWITVNFDQTYDYQYYRIKRDVTTDLIVLYAVEFGLKDNMIRVPTGGVAYADDKGNKSLNDQSKGAYPLNNEWDRYIVNSDLNKRVVQDGYNSWNHDKKYSLCKETPITSIAANTNRVRRVGNADSLYRWYYIASNSVDTSIGFRPVLQYIDKNSKQKSLWY